MELLDIYDEHGNPTGRVETKERAHELGLWHINAHIWIINSNGELLLQLRHPNKVTHPNMWDISAAGHIRAGETMVQGGLRELKEELGVTVSTSELKYLFTINHDPTEPSNNKEINDIFLLSLDWPADKYVFPDTEVVAVKYMPWRDLAKMTHDELLAARILPHAELKGLFEYLDKNGF
ncbi:MAG: NUDIX domain-containing protein [Alphaproteobacteria bacterium]|nr:NUDIX domain-containing protein [Alphaproteobacteria bacterium]